MKIKLEPQMPQGMIFQYRNSAYVVVDNCFGRCFMCINDGFSYTFDMLDQKMKTVSVLYEGLKPFKLVPNIEEAKKQLAIAEQDAQEDRHEQLVCRFN